MSMKNPPERYPSVEEDVRLFCKGTADHECRLEALAKSAETDVREAQASLSSAPESSGDQIRTVLSAQVQRHERHAEAARQLCVSAREQHLVARRLLGGLHPDTGSSPQRDAQSHTPVAVLVVDDYGAAREVVAEVLRNAGFVVRTAANGLEALLAAYETRPAVIVMDMTMPVLDGIEATRLIKANDTTRHARVIAYTGNPTMDDDLVQKFFVAVLQKPATPAAVVATVRHAASLRAIA
jgi:CheY-like chemotaxis protein